MQSVCVEFICYVVQRHWVKTKDSSLQLNIEHINIIAMWNCRIDSSLSTGGLNQVGQMLQEVIPNVSSIGLECPTG